MKVLRSSGTIVVRRRRSMSSMPSRGSRRCSISKYPISMPTRPRKKMPIAWMSRGPQSAKERHRLELRERQRRGGNPDDVLQACAEGRDERTQPTVVVEPPAAACVAVSQIGECVDDDGAGPNDGPAQRDDDDDAGRDQRPLGDRRWQSEQRARQHHEQEPTREDEGTVQRDEEPGEAFIAVLQIVPVADQRLQPRESTTKDVQCDEDDRSGGRQRAEGQPPCAPGVERDR